jgi:hypothetical protein
MITAEAQRKTAKSSQRDEEANLIFNEAESGAELRTKLLLGSASQRLCGKNFCQIKLSAFGFQLLAVFRLEGGKKWRLSSIHPESSRTPSANTSGIANG